MRIGIIAALEDELRGVTELQKEKSVNTVNGIRFSRGTVYKHETVAAVCGIGLVNAALTTQIMLCRFPVDCVINLGAAGALSPELDVRDIVVSRDAAYWEAPRYMPRRGVYPAGKSLHDLCLTACSGLLAPNKIISGRIISGGTFINKLSTRNRLREEFQAECVEMEGAAVAHACCLAGVPFLIVRSVSDSLKHNGKNARAAFEKNLRGAADTLTRVVERMLYLCPEEFPAEEFPAEGSKDERAVV